MTRIPCGCCPCCAVHTSPKTRQGSVPRDYLSNLSAEPEARSWRAAGRPDSSTRWSASEAVGWLHTRYSSEVVDTESGRKGGRARWESVAVGCRHCADTSSLAVLYSSSKSTNLNIGHMHARRHALTGTRAHWHPPGLDLERELPPVRARVA